MNYLSTMMKIGTLLIIALGYHAAIFAQDADDIIGLWETSKKGSHIEIYKKGDEYFGKVAWLKEPNDPETGKPKTDDNGDLILNMEILKEFSFDDDEWEDGTIYDPESGKTYYCSMEFDDDGKLKIRGSVDPMGWLGRTEIWTRVDK